MKFKYVGDETAPKETVFFGKEFKLDGPAVELDGMAAEKALNNPSFEQVKAKKVKK